MIRSRAEEECETLGEAYDEGYQQGRSDTIDEVLDIAYHCVDYRDL